MQGKPTVIAKKLCISITLEIQYYYISIYSSHTQYKMMGEGGGQGGKGQVGVLEMDHSYNSTPFTLREMLLL